MNTKHIDPKQPVRQYASVADTVAYDKTFVLRVNISEVLLTHTRQLLSSVLIYVNGT